MLSGRARQLAAMGYRGPLMQIPMNDSLDNLVDQLSTATSGSSGGTPAQIEALLKAQAMRLQREGQQGMAGVHKAQAEHLASEAAMNRFKISPQALAAQMAMHAARNVSTTLRH